MYMQRNRFTTSWLALVVLCLVTAGCNDVSQPATSAQSDLQVELTDAQMEELVRRSYQYVAMYNVNQKLALADEGMTTRGYNKGLKNTDLLDHTAEFIARPNNDSIYQLAMLDLRKDAVVFEFPAFDSKYVSLMTSGYDHYVDIPLSTVEGDFQEPKTVLFYTARTEGYHGEKVEGVDEIFEMTGDFVSATLRVMPHANEPERYKRIVDQINSNKGMTLSEFLGKPAPQTDKSRLSSLRGNRCGYL